MGTKRSVTGRLRGSYEHETFAKLHTDHEIALARLNSDQRYFMYLEKPEHGIADYLLLLVALLLHCLFRVGNIFLFVVGYFLNILFLLELENYLF